MNETAKSLLQSKHSIIRFSVIAIGCVAIMVLLTVVRYLWVTQSFPHTLKTIAGPHGWIAELVVEPQFEGMKAGTTLLLLAGSNKTPMHIYVDVRLTGHCMHKITVSHGTPNGIDSFADTELEWVGNTLQIVIWRQKMNLTRRIRLDVGSSEKIKEM